MFVLFLSWDLKHTGLVMNFGPVPFVPWGTSQRFGRSKTTQREGFYLPRPVEVGVKDAVTTQPPTHHPWVGLSLQIINLQTELNYLD